METKFKVGDVVKLKSGGPKMVVMTSEEKSVFVVWTNKNDELQSSTLLSEILVKANSSSVGVTYSH